MSAVHIRAGSVDDAAMCGAGAKDTKYLTKEGVNPNYGGPISTPIRGFVAVAEVNGLKDKTRLCKKCKEKWNRTHKGDSNEN